MKVLRMATPGTASRIRGEEPLVAAPIPGTTHVHEDPAARVLQRDVHVTTDFRDLRHRPQYLVIKRCRIGVEETHPGDATHFGELAQEFREPVPDPEILAVGGRILRHQNEFPGTRPGQRLRLGEHRIRITTAEMSTNLWDHTERAGIVATLGHLDVGDVRRGGTNPGGSVVVEPGDRLVGAERRGPPLGSDQDIRNPFDLVEPEDRVDLGDLTCELARVPLRQASGHHQSPAPAAVLELRQLEDGVHSLLLRRTNEPAGVHHERLRLRQIGCHLESAAGEDACHDLAVEQVLRASEAHQPHLRSLSR